MNLDLPSFPYKGKGVLILFLVLCIQDKSFSYNFFTNHDDSFIVTNCEGIDSEPPTASNPATINTDCTAPSPDPAVVTDEADNCPDPITVAFVEDVSNNMICPETITRTYSVTDASGNSITVSQTIIINDLTDPVITCPPNTTVEAGSLTDPGTLGVATAVDNCNPNEDVLFLDNVVSGNCPVLEVIQRTWAAIDDCGNTSICVQNIDVTDTAPPVISCPQAITIEWGSSIDPSVTGSATATDVADQMIEITYSDNEIITGACPNVRSVERTWTATDDCGNTATCLQIITGTDMTPPPITCPSDIDIECDASDQPNNTGQATATDNADASVEISFSDNLITGTCPALNVIERTWTATDDCGNVSNCLQIININDTTPPEITCPTMPGGPTQLGEIEPNDAPLDIGIISLANESIFSGNIGPVTSDATDRWNIQDGLSGDISLQFNFSIHPLTIAALTSFADPARTIEISSQSILAFDPPLTATLQGNLFYSIIIQNPVAGGQGYELSISGPAFPAIPGSTVLECPPGFNLSPVGLNTPQIAAIDPSLVGAAVATDNCGSPAINYQDVVLGPDPSNCPQVLVVERTWTATDDCGQTATCIETFIFTDTTDPVISCPADTTIAFGADDQPSSTGVPTMTDNCDAELNMVFTDVITPVPGCPIIESIERTFVVGDDCGNASNCTQTISITDLVDPIITCPPDAILTCGEDASPESTGFATGTDNLDQEIDISFIDEIIFTGSCPDVQIIERTWSATDDCANRAECVQLIFFRDLEAPIITCPADTTIECGTSIDPSSTGDATATDACSNPQINYSDSVVENCGNTSIITRTWTAVDDCGNSASCTQVITIEDTTAPSITCPDDLTLECSDSVNPSGTGMATGTDACGSVAFDFSDAFSTNCGLAGTITRTWMATDDCGNESVCDQIITLEDTTPPFLSCPSSVSVECGDSTDPSQTGEPIGIDNCGAPQFNFTDSFSPGCAQTGIITRTWTATDDCGNASASCDQTITIIDTTPPILNCPSDITVECGDSTDPSATGTPAEIEACGNAVFSFSDSSSPTCGSTEIITRTWTAADDCGNSISCDQIITIQDLTPPVISCPADITIECGEDILPANTGSASGSDGCGSVTLIYTDITAMDNCGDSRVINRTWSAIDACNNITQCIQTITIIDTEGPTISCPADIAVDCGQSTDPVNTGQPTGIDNCGNTSFNFSDTSSSACGQTQTITRTWTVMDECGNTSSSCEQVITIEDTTPPTLSCAPDITITCGDSTDPAFTGSPSVSDDCGNTSVSFSDSVFPICGGSEVITRTWTVTDDCGNNATCEQLISVIDLVPPSITCPADITIDCSDSTDPVNTGMATAVDGCSSTNIAFTEITETGCGGSAVISRTWTATDDCGNTASCVQTITIADTTPPSITCQDHTASLDGSGLATIVLNDVLSTVSDNCGSVVVTLSQSSFGCTDEGINLVTLTATDECGLTNTCNAIVTVVNPNPIVISGQVTDQLGPVQPDGAIDLQVTGGFPQYSYSWSNGSTTEDISGLASGDYFVTVNDAVGCSAIDTFNVGQGSLLPVEFCITTYLEGVFDPFAVAPLDPLRTTLNELNLLPLTHPYFQPPWNYFGSEQFESQDSIPAKMVDWMLITIRSENDPTTIVEREAVLLFADGSIYSVDGELPSFFLDPAQNYWVEIDHHNHLPVSSAVPITINPDDLQVCLDFTAGMDEAYMNPLISNDPMAEVNSLTGLQYCMISGNALSADFQVDINDVNQIFIHFLEILVYAPWDVNQDGFVDINDINQIFLSYGLIAHRPY
ncbi:MAG: HYR domain-containing protein [Bacteroidota bacterium]